MNNIENKNDGLNQKNRKTRRRFLSVLDNSFVKNSQNRSWSSSLKSIDCDQKVSNDFSNISPNTTAMSLDVYSTINSNFLLNIIMYAIFSFSSKHKSS